MNSAHQRGQASTSSVHSFDESNEHATDYISGMYHDPSSQPSSPLNHHKSPIPPRKKVLPPPPPPKPKSNSSANSSYSNSSVQSTPQGSAYQRSSSSDSNSSSPERKGPTHSRPRLRPPSPPPSLSTQMPLSGFDNDDDGSSPSSPAEIAKELFNLQAFKRMSLDVSNQVSDPDLPNNRISVPDLTDLMEAGVDQDAARLLWVPAHLHPEIAANDDWKDFVQRRVEETKTTGTISRVKSIGGGGSQRRLSRSKSILSRQIDPSDEETYSKYSDAGHAELERRTSRGPGSPTERHMITVAELEKLEALIKEGALERQGRPISGEGIELETIPPLAADVPPPAEDVPPLIPMKGSLKRSAHTSMRNVRRGGLAAVRTARRSSEPKKAGSRISQDSVYEDGIPPAAISPTSPPPHERSESLPGLESTVDDGQSGRLSVDVDRSRTSAPAIMEQLDLQHIGRSVNEVQSPEQMIESNEAVLGQVQPRQLRRPPLRRQTVDAPESLSLAPPPSPPKDKPPLPEKPQKKSPVSPLFPPVPTTSPPPPPVTEPITSIPEEPPSQISASPYPTVPAPPPYQPYTATAQPEQPTPPIPPKRGTWSRLFTSSSDDEQTKEKVSNKGKIKKAASYSESPKPDRTERRVSVESERKSLVETSTTPIIITTAPPPPPVAPSPSPPPQTSTKQQSKKESGLFASIFGSKKKSESKDKAPKGQDSNAVARPASQDRSQYARHGPGGWGDAGATAGPPVLNYYYTRFPIHVERAIYRLSHIKLANPRRPLLQQVLLSNFMYGYLNLINKTAQPQQPQQQQQAQQEQQQQQDLGQQVPQQQENYVEQPSQQEEHVFYSTEDQTEYYGQDYYGAEYEDDQDDTVPQGHETGDFGYDYQPQTQQPPSQNTVYNHSYDPQTNGRREDEDVANTYILRDSRGRVLPLPKSTSEADQDPPYTAQRYHS